MPMGGLELLIVLVILLLFFGAKRVPQLARSLGVGARELKKAASEEDNDSETKTTSEKETTSKKDVTSEKDAGGGKAETVSHDAPSERDGDRAQREPQDR